MSHFLQSYFFFKSPSAKQNILNIQIQNKFIRKPVSFINFMTTYHTFICTMYRSVTPFSINLCSLKKNPKICRHRLLKCSVIWFQFIALVHCIDINSLKTFHYIWIYIYNRHIQMVVGSHINKFNNFLSFCEANHILSWWQNNTGN